MKDKKTTSSDEWKQKTKDLLSFCWRAVQSLCSRLKTHNHLCHEGTELWTSGNDLCPVPQESVQHFRNGLQFITGLQRSRDLPQTVIFQLFVETSDRWTLQRQTLALGWIAWWVDSWEPPHPEKDVGIYLFDCDLEENHRPIITNIW